MFNKCLSLIFLAFFISSPAHALTELEYMTEEYPPYNFKDENGQLHGIAVDLLEEALKALKVDKDRSKFRLLPWARGYNKAQQPGEMNVLFATTRTEERENLFTWVGPISPTEISTFSKSNVDIIINNDDDLKPYRYAVIRGDIGELLLKSKGVTDKNIIPGAQFEQLLKMVLRDRAGMFAYEKNVASYLIKKLKYHGSDFKEVYTLKKAELYYSFNKSVPKETTDAYQNAIDKIKANPAFQKMIAERYF